MRKLQKVLYFFALLFVLVILQAVAFAYFGMEKSELATYLEANPMIRYIAISLWAVLAGCWLAIAVIEKRPRRGIRCLAYFLVFVIGTTGCGTHTAQLATVGGMVGAAGGYLITKSGKGAAAGAVVGILTGAALGTIKDVRDQKKAEAAIPAPPPRVPALEGKKFVVVGSQQFGTSWLSVLTPVVQQELRQSKGMVIVANPGYYYCRDAPDTGVDYCAEVGVVEQGRYLQVTLQMVNRATGVAEYVGARQIGFSDYTSYDVRLPVIRSMAGAIARDLS